MTQPSPKKFWSQGIRFECQGSGKCCVSRGSYGYVYLTINDRRRFAKYFKLPTQTFTKRFCRKKDGLWHLKSVKGECEFLKQKRCTVYDARPEQCRTWPFWPEHMKPKVWEREIAGYCPGVGKGKLIPGDTIDRILRSQKG